MEVCPNIGGNQLKMRIVSGYIGLVLTLLSILYVSLNDSGFLKAAIFFPSVIMTVSFLEAYDKTCIVYSAQGIKHMGDKFQKEKDSSFLKIQRSKSVKIVLRGVFLSLAITLAIYFLF